MFRAALYCSDFLEHSFEGLMVTFGVFDLLSNIWFFESTYFCFHRVAGEIPP